MNTQERRKSRVLYERYKESKITGLDIRNHNSETTQVQYIKRDTRGKFKTRREKSNIQSHTKVKRRITQQLFHLFPFQISIRKYINGETGNFMSLSRQTDGRTGGRPCFQIRGWRPWWRREGMAYVNVAEWSPDQVSEWLKGKRFGQPRLIGLRQHGQE